MLAVPADTRVDEYERSGYLAVLEQARRRHGL